MSSDPSHPVLVVDDESMMVDVMSRLLVRIGYTDVDHANDALTALEMMQATSYSLVICDWSMKPMSGYGMLCRIRSDPVLKHTPFIMATTQTVMRNAIAAKSAGVDAYLLKPFSQDSLKRAIDAAVRRL